MTGFPINPPNAVLVDPIGRVSPEWYKFFVAIQRKIGGPSDPFDDSILLAALPSETGGTAFPDSAPPAIIETNDDRIEPYGAQMDAALNADKQPADPTLTALAEMDATPGLVTQTATDTFAKRSLVAPAAGVTITNPAGTAGDPTFALANDLAALEGLGSTGLAVRTASDTWAQRTLQAPAAGLSITNPAGVAGDPVFAFANDLAALEGLSSTGIAVRSASDTWVQRTITGTANEVTVADGGGVAGNPTLSLPTALTFTGKTVTGGTFSSPTLVTPTLGVASATSVNFGGGALSEYVPPTSPSFSAGDFTASGAMTFTVAAGDVVTYAYSIIGKMMTVWFMLQTASVGGVLDRYLYIAVPAGKSAAETQYSTYLYNQGTWAVGQMSIVASDTAIRLEKIDNSNWASSSDATYLSGTFTFAIA